MAPALLIIWRVGSESGAKFTTADPLFVRLLTEQVEYLLFASADVEHAT